MSLPGDTMYRGRHLTINHEPEQRRRALVVLAAGITQGSDPRASLAAAARLNGPHIVDEMIADGLIAVAEDGTLSAASTRQQ